MENDHVYIAIDLKSYYASCECADRKFDPLTTNLVVADMSRTEKTICCYSIAIYEEEIKPVLYEVFRDTKADADAMVAEYVRMYNELTINGALPQKIEEQQKIIDMANRKKNKLLQLAADDSITNADFKSMTAACNEEIRAAEEEIAELEQAALEGEEFRRKIEEIKKVLANAQRDAAGGVITKEFVDKYIDKIFVTPTDDNTLLLQIKIFTGETTEKYLRKFEHRLGIITGELTKQQENQVAARGSEPCVSAGHTFKTAIHETAHSKLHDRDVMQEQGIQKDQMTREVEAESIAYTVCQHFGLDTSEYSFPYIAGWSSSKDAKELKSSLDTIRKTASELIDGIEGSLKEKLRSMEAEKDKP